MLKVNDRIEMLAGENNGERGTILGYECRSETYSILLDNGGLESVEEYEVELL